MSKKIEAIIVCKGYSNYLEITLPLNKKYFDNIIVVTDEFDGRTHKVCKDNNIGYIIYNGFNKNGAKFNFGGARQFGLEYIKFNKWICYLDCDCIINEDFREKITDINKVYGSYRRFIPTFKDYNDLVNKAKNKNDFLYIVGTGCGFLQIFNYNNRNCLNKLNLYEDSFSAENVDIKFLRKLCPFDGNRYYDLVYLDIDIWHLGSSDGQNHEGITGEDKFFNNNPSQQAKIV